MTVRVTLRTAEIQKRLEQAAEEAINQTTAACDTAAKALLNRSAGGGRTYHKGQTKSTFYQASAPGEPPVRVSGILQGSITSRAAQRVGRRTVGQWGACGPGTEDKPGYALWLEIGTSTMAARPYLRPTAQTEYPKLAGRVKKLFAGGK